MFYFCSLNQILHSVFNVFTGKSKLLIFPNWASNNHTERHLQQLPNRAEIGDYLQSQDGTEFFQIGSMVKRSEVESDKKATDEVFKESLLQIRERGMGLKHLQEHQACL